jgi:3-hydroxybutyryl-CoA dehydratase
MKYYEDFHVGDKKVSRGRTITEADIVLFSAFTGDWYPVHVDVEYARKSQFGERIAHGFLVLSVASGLMPLYDEAIVALFAIDNVRFFKPTKIGDTLHLEIEYTGKEDRNKKGGVVDHYIKVINQRNEVAASYVLRGLIGKRPEGQ